MREILMILVIVLNIFYIIASIYKIKHYNPKTKESQEGKPCITFDEFLALYEASPDRFVLKENYVCVNMEKLEGIPISIWKTCDYYFETKKDLSMYIKYKDSIKKKMDNEYATESRKKLMNLIRDDLKNKKGCDKK